VGQRWVTEWLKEGEETLSNVLGPDRPVVVFYPDEKLREQVRRDEVTLQSLGFSMSVSFGPANQGVNWPGAHLKVSQGGRAWHYWTPRMEGKQDFAADTPASLGLYCRVNVPMPQGGGPVVFDGDWQGQTATRTLRVKLTPHPKDLEGIENNAKTAAANHKTMVDMDEGELRRQQEWIEKAQRKLAEKPPGLKTFPEFYEFVEARKTVIGSEACIQIIKESNLPVLHTDFERREAERKGDWAAAIAAGHAELDARKRGAVLDLAHWRAKIAVDKKLYALPNAPPNSGYVMAPTYDKLMAEYNFSIKGAWNGYLCWLRDMSESICNTAFAAGDAKLYRRAGLLGLAAMNELKLEPAQIGARLKKFAGEYATLSADRDAAAPMLVLAYQLNGKSDKTPWDYYGGPPAWWPPAPDGISTIHPAPPTLEALVSEYQSDVTMPAAGDK
jgi:hypothetical protein